MNAIQSDRLGALLAVTLLATLGAGTFWMVEASKSGDRTRISQSAHTPGAVAANIQILRTDESGKPLHRLRAEGATQFVDDSSVALTNIHIESLRPDRPHWEGRANSARINGDQSVVDLSESVVLTRHADALAPKTTVTTHALRIFPDTEIAQTDADVTVTRGQSSLSGTGLTFNNPARTLEVHANARLLIAPKK